MMNSLLRIVIVFYITQLTACEQDWYFELESVNSTTTNPQLAELIVDVIRINRGQYAFSGTFVTNIEFNDTTKVDVDMFYSSSGKDEDYSHAPSKAKNMPFSHFMSFYYKEFLMNNLNSCAENAPKFDKFLPPLPKQSIRMDKCLLTTEGFSNIMENGKYKFLVAIHSPSVGLSIELVAYVEQNE
ncbi:uncharacterized protein LOC142239205 [Haematobia irritans]|uniref:uncharacterized protein LOC142239205 n=1 Tax=Haematobia irritans TaxID=7368 RepID=UPI003F4FFA6D